MCLKTPHLKFLDVTNYLTPGFSYEKVPQSVRVLADQMLFPIRVGFINCFIKII
jgi:hypothetical protein